MEQSRSHCVILLTSLLLLLGTLPSPTMAGPGGNSANAKLCQKGGWEDLQRSDGTPFANQGACVSYAARGGTLEPKAPRTVTVTFVQGSLGDIGFCGVQVDVTGFPQDIHDLLITSEQEDDYPTLIEVGPGGTGTTRTIPPDLVGGTLWPEGDIVVATVSGVTVPAVSSAPAVVSC